MNDSTPSQLIGLHLPNWLDELQEQVESDFQQWPGTHVYALLDCAFSEHCYHAIQSHRLPSRSLYDLSVNPSEQLQAVSPTLIPLMPTCAKSWRAILSLTDGLPMLSIIVTSESLDALALRLQPWCIVNADGQAFVFRFPDTRRLPGIVSVLTPEQHGAFFGPAYAWRYRTRSTQWTSLPLPADVLPPAEWVKLDANQCARLINDSEADTIIADLHLTEPVLMKRYHPADAHELITFGLKRADHHGIADANRTHWCSLVLQQPRLNQLAESTPLLAALATKECSYADIEDELAALARQ